MRKTIILSVMFFALTFGFFSACSVSVRPDERNPLSAAGAYIYIRDNTVKVTRDEELTFDGSEKLCISLARNEGEGAQFIFRRENADTSSLSVSVSDLVCEENGEKLTASDMTVYRQRYHLVDKVFDGQALGAGYYPDALLDLKTADNSVTVEKGQNQGYWITVRAGSSTAAGLYKGTVSVTFDGGSIDIPVECTVWDFEISAVNHLGSSFGSGNTDKYDGQKTEFYETLMNSFRANLFFLPVSNGSPTGSDFGAYEEYIKKETVTDALWLFRPPYNEETKEVYITDSIKRVYKKMRDGDWLDKVYTNLYFDEPNPDMYEMIGIIARKVREELPGLKIVISSTSGIPSSLSDCVDWCVKPDAVDRETVSDQHEKGLEVWWYTCNFPVYPCPTMHINDYLVSPRITGIMSDDYGIDGFLYWNVSLDKKYEKTSEGGYAYTYTRNMFEDIYICDEWPAGDGSLVYQGRANDGEVNANALVPSLRMEAFRDGMEDYEYLYVLRDKYEKIAEKLGICVDTHSLLQVWYDNLYENATSYYSDGSRLTKTRKQIAEAILSDDKYLFSVVHEKSQTDPNVRKVTVYADTDADVLINGTKAEKTAEKTYSLDISIPNTEEFILTLSFSDESAEKAILILPSRMEEEVKIVSSPTVGHIDDENIRFRISSSQFADGNNLWKDFDGVRMTVRNLSAEKLSGLVCDIVYPVRKTTCEIPDIEPGQTLIFEMPIDPTSSKQRVSSLVFRLAEGGEADIEIISATAVKLSSE